LITSIQGFTGSILNIPEVVGPQPTTPRSSSQHHTFQGTANLHQQENLYQENLHQDYGNHCQNSPRIDPQHSTNAQGEGPFCWYQEEIVQDGIKNCKHSLIGKLLSEKIVPKQIIFNTLLGIWGNPKGLQITEVEGGYYHITMDMEGDLKRAVRGNPWTIRNVWLMVKQWDREKNPTDLEFHKVPTWLQLWGLPLHCKTVTMGKHLGSQLGVVEEAAIYDFPDKARIVKIKVQLDITDPIKPGIFIGNTKDGIKWVDFRYENLPMFCFLCGLIGHNENNCSNPHQPVEEGEINPRGPWLRSNSYGRRVSDKKDTRFSSNPMKSMSGGSYSLIPKAMIEMLATMRLEEDSPSPNTTHTTGQTVTEATKDHQGTSQQKQAQETQALQKTQNTNTSQQLSNSGMAGLVCKASQQS
jgi:hypothetical protein